jgi:hypothetical protein
MSTKETKRNTESPSGDRGFFLGPVSKAYRGGRSTHRKRLRQWLCIKHKVRWPGKKRFPTASFYQVLGLVSLAARTASFPWAKP